MTLTFCLKSKVLDTIHFNPRVEWERKEKVRAVAGGRMNVEANGRVVDGVPNAKRKHAEKKGGGNKRKALTPVQLAGKSPKKKKKKEKKHVQQVGRANRKEK